MLLQVRWTDVVQVQPRISLDGAIETQIDQDFSGSSDHVSCVNSAALVAFTLHLDPIPAREQISDFEWRFTELHAVDSDGAATRKAVHSQRARLICP